MTDYALPRLIDLLGAEDLAALRSLGQRKAYRDGETVHLRGDSDPSMGVVVEGIVRLYRQMSSGQQLLTVSMTPGQHYADVQVCGIGRRTHTAIAEGETLVDHYPRESFNQLLEHPGITRALYEIAVYRLAQAVEIVDDIRSLPTEVRLAKTIAVIQRSTGAKDKIECKQEEMANLLGVSAMTVAKAFKTLRKEGLVETGYRHVAIPDTARLQAWIDERNWD